MSQGSKVLMLSATPFKPYTNDFDSMNGEIHYNEFRTVLKFLLGERSATFWTEYEADRKKLFGSLGTLVFWQMEITMLFVTKTKLENVYRQAMVRTERFLAARDRDALIKKVHTDPVSLFAGRYSRLCGYGSSHPDVE